MLINAQNKLKRVVIIGKNRIYKFLVMIIIFIGLTANTYVVNADEIQSSELENYISGIKTENKEIEEANNQYITTVSDEIINLNSLSLPASLKSNILTLNNKVGAAITANSSSYDLRNYYDVRVKNQGMTNCCWAFSLISSTEMNMLIKKGINVDLSEKHANYATSNSFSDGTNSLAFNRTASDGSSFIIGLAYLTNGQGAVLESQMPFSENTSNISLSEIDIDPSYYVTGYEILPTIYKIKSDGKTLYTDGYGKYYSETEVTALRKIIKQHIIEDGAISTYMAAAALEYYSNPENILASKAYYCDNMNYSVDHAVTIVGWDDNYSKDNFTGASKPDKDGAYIVLNSYSDNYFDNGYMYVSYEDVWIETMLYGITDTSSIDYKNLYQHDEFGGNVAITLATNSGAIQEAYYASVYSRNSSDSEAINRVSVTTNQYAKLEIYVNPNGSDLSSSNLKLVATTDVLSPGYNTISFDSVKLTGSEFAVVVKQKAINETLYIMVEANVEDTMYATATANSGDSKVSANGVTWRNLGDLGTIDYNGHSVDLSKADVCIKAFTVESKEPEISSSVYEISSDNYITKIYDKTTINDFLKNMTLLNTNYEFIDKNNNNVTDYNSYVTTNMTLKTDDKTYTLVVRGDMSCDGEMDIVDFSKQILHYVEYDGFVLSGAQAKAADINLDGEFDIVDVSKLKLILVNGE